MAEIALQTENIRSLEHEDNSAMTITPKQGSSLARALLNQIS